MSESRSEFEAWLALEMPSGCVADMERGWQASRRAALEEAAKVCDGLAVDHDEDAVLEVDERYAVYAKHQRNCASAIRAIARKEKA